MNTGNWPESTQLSSSFGLEDLDSASTGAQEPDPSPGRWRRLALLLLTVAGCLAIFLLARLLALQPTVPADWRITAEGRLELSGTPHSRLRPYLGNTLEGVVSADGDLIPIPATLLGHSARWTADDARRSGQIQAFSQISRMLAAGEIRLRFSGYPEPVTLPLSPRGYPALGAIFWLLSALAMVLFLVGAIVPLMQLQLRNLLYALMAFAQAGSLLMSAASTVPGLALPPLLVLWEAPLHLVLDMLTGVALVHAVTLHPIRLPYQPLIVGGTWLLAAVLALGVWTEPVPQLWWWTQALLLLDGIICISLLGWTLRTTRHPFAAVMRRFALITVITLALLTGAVALMPLLPTSLQPAAQVGPMIWSVFFASMILLVPFISRSQHVMREFAMLAGISTVATSVDLLFVAVFSFGQFASLALSLFLALGAYAAIRQWLVARMMGARAITTERMFQHLYRIAREVEARPERAAERMVELLRNVYEPLETEQAPDSLRRSRIAGNGALLLVPLPNLVEGPSVQGLVVLRFAERGSRLFTEEDARLADRILEQLMRALAHDRAVERGRSEERARIAQDLHDDIGARLLTLMYKAPSQEMEDYVRHTLQDLKTLTRGLAAKSHSLALASAEWKTDIAHRLEAARCTLIWESSFDQEVTLTMVQWSSLTRILRELVSNVIAHSHATQVRIQCQLERGEFRIDLTDDGQGQHPEKWAHGLGLGGIRKRVKLMGGKVSWRELSPTGIGCSVVIPALCKPD